MLKTTIVGSYPQPDWLIDRAALGSQAPPRVRARELWRVDPSLLAQAQDDATELAVRTMERIGLDIVTDGEVRRESYSNHFATALEGLDIDNPGEVVGRGGRTSIVPRVVGPISRPGPVGVRDVAVPGSLTNRTVKATVPGPFTLSQQALDEHYGDGEGARARVRRRGQCRAARSRRGGRGRRPDRRAVAPVAPGGGARVRRRGRRPGARGNRRDDRAPRLLRVRGAREGEARPVRLPDGAQRHRGRSDLDRGGPAAARPVRARRAFARRRSSSASSTSATTRSRRRRSSPDAFAQRWSTSSRSG